MVFIRTMLLILFTGLAALSSAHAVEPNSVAHDFADYAKLYPTHVEYCAGTELSFIGGVAGGPGGHGFTYIHGLCKDYSKDYPQVKPCDGTENHQGVGVSVNSDFDNVNWVATPTHSLLIDADLHQGERVTSAVVDRVADEATDYKVFQNVILNKPELTRDSAGRQLKPGTPEYLRAVARNSEGTDFAVRLARNLECVRVPIRKEKLKAIADHLNGLNNKYYGTGVKYIWSGFTNNCAHVASEILAAAGIRDAIPKELSKTKQIFNIALPRNGVYTLINNGIMRSVLPWDVYKRAEDRASIESDTPFMPTQVGVLAKKYSAFKDNAVFAISGKALWMVQKEGNVFLDRAAFKVPAYSEINENLLAWEKTLLKQSDIVNAEWNVFQAAKWELQSGGIYSTKGYKDFEPYYDRYVSEQLKGVQAKLTARGLKGISN